MFRNEIKLQTNSIETVDDDLPLVKIENSCNPLIELSRKKDEIMGNLDDAIMNRKDVVVREILANRQYVELLIKNRETNGSNYDLLKRAVDFLISQELGSCGHASDAGRDNLFKWIHETDMPEYILNQISTSSYHVSDGEGFNDMQSMIMNGGDAIKDKSVLLRAYVDQASWAADRRKDYAESIRINSEVIIAARKLDRPEDIALNDVVAKAKFAKVVNGNLPASEKLKRLQELFRAFSDTGNGYDAIRALNSAASTLTKLADSQKAMKQQSLSDENLALAKNYLDLAHDLSNKTGYTNALIWSWKVRAEYDLAIGKTEKSKKNLKTAMQLKAKYDYKTDILR